MAYRRGNTDRISHLPSEIIEKILILLPCRDAVRTCILSSDWRYKWTSISDLNFGEAWTRGAYKHANFITQCLLIHQGPIRKFSVTARNLTVARKIEQWINMVSKHDIEELELDFSSRSWLPIRSPSCLFNCKKLTHLKLSNCLLDVPPTFEGFVNLKVLNLSSIEVKDKSSIESLISKCPLLENLNLHFPGVSNVTISAPKVFWNSKELTSLDLSGVMLTIPPTFEGFVNLKSLKLSVIKMDKSSIESLISKSPSLESLSFVSMESDTPITISAPKIKYLSMRGDLRNIGLEKSPVLVDMRLCLSGDSRDCDLIKILGAASNLEKLTVQYFQRLKFGCYGGVLSTTFSYLKVMTLDGFDLGKSKAIQLVLELLRSAPNLEKLVVVIHNSDSHSLPNEADSNFWQKEYRVGHCFMKLKVVQMGYMLCKAPQIEFAKFILSNSPVLEKMMIGTIERNEEIRTRALKELQTLPRASTQVAVTFHHGGVRTVVSLES